MIFVCQCGLELAALPTGSRRKRWVACPSGCLNIRVYGQREQWAWASHELDAVEISRIPGALWMAWLNCADASCMAMQRQARDGPKSGANSGRQHHCQAADVAGAQGPGIWEVLHRLPLHPQLHLRQPPHGHAARPAPHPRICQAPGRHVQWQGRD